jgi:hypothetical protein
MEFEKGIRDGRRGMITEIYLKIYGMSGGARGKRNKDIWRKFKIVDGLTIVLFQRVHA